jgi:DNA integrity scanning protein DisA with diadenylate cyclase activity
MDYNNMAKKKIKKQPEIELNEKELKKLEETLLQVALRISKRGEGALMVVGDVKYRPLVDQSVPPFKVVNNPKLLETLALIDGAVVINNKGILEAYGVMIKTTRTLKNFGTRHSAALSAAKKDNIVVMVSEEEKKVKVLKKGKMVMQLDSLQKNVEKSVPKAVEILESVGAGTIGTLGASLLIPGLGIALLPGVVVFGSAYYLAKVLSKKFR